MRTEPLQKAIDTWGIYLQLIIAVEEMTEPNKELLKIIRYSNADNISSLIEEISDVYIMLETIKIGFDIPEKTIQDKIAEKIKRLEKRLENKP